jgi:hypothetical protein
MKEGGERECEPHPTTVRVKSLEGPETVRLPLVECSIAYGLLRSV